MSFYIHQWYYHTFHPFKDFLLLESLSVPNKNIFSRIQFLLYLFKNESTFGLKNKSLKQVIRKEERKSITKTLIMPKKNQEKGLKNNYE